MPSPLSFLRLVGLNHIDCSYSRGLNSRVLLRNAAQITEAIVGADSCSPKPGG